MGCSIKDIDRPICRITDSPCQHQLINKGIEIHCTAKRIGRLDNPGPGVVSLSGNRDGILRIVRRIPLYLIDRVVIVLDQVLPVISQSSVRIGN